MLSERVEIDRERVTCVGISQRNLQRCLQALGRGQRLSSRSQILRELIDLCSARVPQCNRSRSCDRLGKIGERNQRRIDKGNATLNQGPRADDRFTQRNQELLAAKNQL